MDEKVVSKKYTKGQVIESDRYKSRADLINALWTDEKEKSLDEVDKMIDKFMKGRVD